MLVRGYQALAVVVCLASMVGCSQKKPIVEIPPTNEPLSDTTGLPTTDVPAPDTAGFGTDSSTAALGTDDESTSPMADVFFDFDRYALSSSARQTLRKNAGWLRATPGARVLIEGHCDERGTEEYNLALGDRRALAVRRYLVDLGIAPQRLTAVSYGEARPKDDRSNEAAWARNRRAHSRVLSD